MHLAEFDGGLCFLGPIIRGSLRFETWFILFPTFYQHPNEFVWDAWFSRQFLLMIRRFPVVERQWRTACKAENENSSNDNLNYTVYPLLPTDSELAAAFVERKKRWVYKVYFITLVLASYSLQACIIISLHFYLRYVDSYCYSFHAYWFFKFVSMVGLLWKMSAVTRTNGMDWFSDFMKWKCFKWHYFEMMPTTSCNGQRSRH